MWLTQEIQFCVASRWPSCATRPSHVGVPCSPLRLCQVASTPLLLSDAAVPGIVVVSGCSRQNTRHHVISSRERQLAGKPLHVCRLEVVLVAQMPGCGVCSGSFRCQLGWKLHKKLILLGFRFGFLRGWEPLFQRCHSQVVQSAAGKHQAASSGERSWCVWSLSTWICKGAVHVHKLLTL
jgi:hypothetical protein